MSFMKVGLSAQSKERGFQTNPKQILGNDIQVWKSANPGQRLLHIGSCFNCAVKIWADTATSYIKLIFPFTATVVTTNFKSMCSL